MIKLMLNTQKHNNYAFFCPVSRLHLTVSNPVGYTNEVTSAISKALKNKTLIDVDGVIEAGAVEKQTTAEPVKKEEKIVENVKEEAPTEEPVKTTEETPVEEKPKKTTRKTTSK